VQGLNTENCLGVYKQTAVLEARLTMCMLTEYLEKSCYVACNNLRFTPRFDRFDGFGVENGDMD